MDLENGDEVDCDELYELGFAELKEMSFVKKRGRPRGSKNRKTSKVA